MDPREEGKLEGLLRHGLKEAVAGEECPGPELLAAYFERSLEEAESLRFETHLSSCARCREELAILARTESLEEAAAEELAAPVEPLGRAKRASALKRLWFWGLFAPAAATAAAVLVFWVGVRHAGPTLSRRAAAPPVPVAVNKPVPSPVPVIESKAQAVQGPVASGNPAIVQSEKTPAPAVRANAAPSKRKTASAGGRADVSANPPQPAAKQARGAPAAAPAPLPRLAVRADKTETPPASEQVTVNGAPSVAGAQTAKEAPIGAAGNAQAAAPAGGVLLHRSTQRESGVSPTADTRAENAATNSVSAKAFAETVTIVPSGTTLIRTPDAAFLWRIKSGRFVEVSSDAGRTWEPPVLTSVIPLGAGAAPSANVCWIVGRNGMILRTKNHHHFERIQPPVVADLVAVEAQDANSATVTLTDGRKFTTPDAGHTWQPLP